VSHRFSRLSSTQVALQAHVRDDSRYVILPVMQPSTVRAWTIYDAMTGRIVETKPFSSFIEAKQWLDKEGK